MDLKKRKSIWFNLLSSEKNYPSVEEFSLINPILNINVVSNYCGKKNTFFKSPNDIYINKKKNMWYITRSNY